MSTRIAVAALFVAAWAAVPLPADDTPAPAGEAGKNAAFEQFKRLAGDWVGKEPGKDGKEVRVRYKVTAGGSAVVETIMPGGEHEMVSVIHPDGADLLLTHYCMLGNQPQMRAAAPGAGNTVAFKFVRATNLKSEKDMHMHDATFTFVDADTLRTAWTHYRDGKAGGEVVFELKRAKAAKQ
jgi:hypothetical protein